MGCKQLYGVLCLTILLNLGNGLSIVNAAEDEVSYIMRVCILLLFPYLTLNFSNRRTSVLEHFELTIQMMCS